MSLNQFSKKVAVSTRTIYNFLYDKSGKFGIGVEALKKLATEADAKQLERIVERTKIRLRKKIDQRLKD